MDCDTDPGDHTLTPDQLCFPKHIRSMAYKSHPPTCCAVRGILDELGRQIMHDCDIPAHDIAAVDAAVSYAFMRIRDEITQPFRTVQMQLLSQIKRKRND